MASELERVSKIAKGLAKMGDLAGLQKFVPASFDWGTEVAGKLLHATIAAGLVALADRPRYVSIVEWMVKQGADPMTEVTFPRAVESNGVKIEGQQSAVSMVLALLEMKQGHEDCIRTSYLQQILHVLSGFTTAKRKKVVIDEAALQRWEGIRNKVATHNVTFDTADGPVTAHDVVLMVASPVLAAMLESSMTEGTSKRIQVEDSSAAAVSLFLDMVYMSATASELDYKTVLGALDISHRWEVLSVVIIFEDMLEDMITGSSFAEIAECAVLKGLDGLQKACIKFAGTNKAVKALVTWQSVG